MCPSDPDAPEEAWSEEVGMITGSITPPKRPKLVDRVVWLGLGAVVAAELGELERRAACRQATSGAGGLEGLGVRLEAHWHRG